ncbi:structure-specific endonuclease subunit EME1-like [Haemaphysalis longicornis]
MASACIILDSDDEDEVPRASPKVAMASPRNRSRSNDGVQFVDLCSDAEENGVYDDYLLTEGVPLPARSLQKSWEASAPLATGSQLLTSTPDGRRQTSGSCNGGSNNTTSSGPGVRVSGSSLWDSDEEELPPLSARLQLVMGGSTNNSLEKGTKRVKEDVHKISESEEDNDDDDGLPDIMGLSQVLRRLSPPPPSSSIQPVTASRTCSSMDQGVQLCHCSNSISVSTIAGAEEREEVFPVAMEEEEPAEEAPFTHVKPKRARLTPEEREARRLAKEQEKQRKAAATELGRATKPAHCLKYVTVVLDFRLLEDASSMEVVSDTLRQAEIRSEVQTLPVERAVSWNRTALSLDQEDCTLAREQVEESDVLVVLPWDQFLCLVASQKQAGPLLIAVFLILRTLAFIKCTMGDPGVRTQPSLGEHLLSIQGVYPGKQLSYVVYGLEKYFKKEKSRVNAQYRALVLGSQQATARKTKKPGGAYEGPSLTRKDIQEAVVPLQLDHGVTVATKETPQELAEYLVKFTRALAERPHREAKQSRPFHRLAPGSLSKHDSLRRTWQAQLEQFASVSRDVAEAIVSHYPAPRLLLQAYQACEHKAAGEALLADIQVRRGAGVLESTRRVGPAISGRIYRFFVASDQEAYFD